MSTRSRVGGPLGLADRGPRLTPEGLAAANRPLTLEEEATARADDAAESERRAHLPVVDHPEDVPPFADDEAWAAFWDTHRMGPRLEVWVAGYNRGHAQARGASAPPKQPAPISLRLEAETVRRLKALAARKGTKYQTLLKAFVQERLYEEEKREGLLR